MEKGPGLLGRLLGKKRRPRAARETLAHSEPLVGLCFDYERGLAYDSLSLSDAGLEHILKVLRSHGLRATFNCPAKLCETAVEQLEMIAEAGHELGVLGYADESPRDLTDDAIRQLVYTCRNAFLSRGFQPIGFRSPHSHWDQRLCVELAKQHFRYDAEHDHAEGLYVLVEGDPPLMRLPLRTDDRALRRREEKALLAMSKHHRLVRKAVQGRRFVAICFHPWILAEEPERMRHWEEWLETAIGTGAKIVALEDALPQEYRRASPAADD